MHILFISPTLVYNLFIPLITIPIIDYSMCKMFSDKTRWFQLHATTNLIITYIISNDVIDLFKKPLTNIRPVSSNMDCYFIVFLHIYHLFIVNKLTIMDYFHHIIFIGFGILPCLTIIDNNITKIAFLTCCGIPGTIEYFCLSLVKHNKLNSLNQKYIMTLVYNYIRCPLCIFCISITYIAYLETNRIKNNLFSTLYFSFLLYLNGTFYNKLTMENYLNHYFNNKYIIYKSL